MKKYWLHRITGGENASAFSYPLLFKHNILSIGWSVLSNDKFVKDSISKGEDAINDALEAKDWGKPRGRWSLWRFIHEMKKGDVVLVPTYGGLFSVFEISSDKVYSNESIDKSLLVDDYGNGIINSKDGFIHTHDNETVDIGFYREVSPIETDIPRNGYADQALTSRMKIRQTNADITDICDSVINAIAAFRQNKPINIKERIMEKSAPEILNLIKQLADDTKFEELVGHYLKSIGADDIITPSKNGSATDKGDADKIAVFENIKTIIMVQIKKHEGITDQWAIQQIKTFRENLHYDDDYSTQMWIISTCDDYSEEAKKEAESVGVRLINGIEFCKMILNTGLKGLDL